jgi:hypothetical protein
MLRGWTVKNRRKPARGLNILQRRELDRLVKKDSLAKALAKNPDYLLEFECRKYGVTAHWYREQEAKQNGVCALCGRPERAKRNGKVKRLSIDHNHDESQYPRGLLCYRCNVNLAVLEDLAWCAKARAYIAAQGF